MLTSVDGEGNTYTRTYNGAGELTSLSSSYSDANHPPTLFSEAAYDAPGQLTIDLLGNGVTETRTYNSRLRMTGLTAGSSYTYNAEDEMTSSSAGVSYVYDGDGNRVEKSNGTLYWYGMGSEVLEKTSLTGSAPSDYIFFDGQRVGSRNPSATVIYVNDHLGSNRISASVATGGSTAPVQWDADYYPFGRIKTFTDTSGPTFRFTGKELDSETGLDNFGARYYSSNLGRFMIADWSAVPAPVPYANLTNPQTLNLYAMVTDNPETFGDLDGHECNTASSGSVPGDHNTCAGPAATKTDKQGDGQSTGDGLQKSPTQQTQTQTSTQTYTDSAAQVAVLQQTTTTKTTDANGNVTTTETSTTLRFSTAPGHEGQFVSGDQRSSMTVTDAKGNSMLLGAEHSRLGADSAHAAVGDAAFARGRSAAIPSAATRYVQAHRNTIIIEELALPLIPLRLANETYQVAKEVFEGLLVAHSVWELSQ